MRVEDRIQIAKSLARDWGCDTDNPPRCETCRYFDLLDHGQGVCRFGPPTEQRGHVILSNEMWCSQWNPRFDMEGEE